MQPSVVEMIQCNNLTSTTTAQADRTERLSYRVSH